jgi:GDP/UDP-N,N'-diacetylbacillosamine 2-epimerase (hydrolysing)
MKSIGVLTSSRADYGIYKPLLTSLKNHESYCLKIISFGTHLSPFHGYTINQILSDGFDVNFRINSLLLNDDENSVASGYALTALKFADFWDSYRKEFDLVLCLGDRYEMYGAVSAGIPYQVKFAHLHGGETTLGAIDNIYRHCISLASSLHFTSTAKHSSRVESIIGNSEGIYNVGALSLDGVNNIDHESETVFRNKYLIPEGDYILTTFHPESKNSELNHKYVVEMSNAIKKLAQKYIFVFSMPNADTLGTLYRDEIKKLRDLYPKRIVCVENFGKRDYFTAMKYSLMMLGNSSSGIIEGATFHNYVVNIGSRQQGRTVSENIIQKEFTMDEIISGVLEAQELGIYTGTNKYYMENTSSRILKILETYL